MSQNVWATIMPFGPVTLNFLLAQKFFFGPALFQALLGKGHSNDHSFTVWVQSVH
jgi:hypothetical protein